jgi:hypothetical protein
MKRRTKINRRANNQSATRQERTAITHEKQLTQTAGQLDGSISEANQTSEFFIHGYKKVPDSPVGAHSVVVAPDLRNSN